MNSWYTVRFARWIKRLVWNRRTGWSLVCLISMLTLYYQWENCRSAQELKAAHERMVKRIGTDDALAFAPPTLPDEQNYFALPVIEKWATGELRRGSRFKLYHIPQDAFLPRGFAMPELVEDDQGGASRIDFAAWAAKRPPSSEATAVVMDRELGDANGLLPQLAAGLNRPFACFKPSRRETLEAAGENVTNMEHPQVSNLNDGMRALGLHLRSAAAAGHADKARQTALILLRLFPESAASYGTLICSLVSTGSHDIAFAALQDALEKPVWDDASLHALQMQLAKINDLQVVEQAMCADGLWGFGEGIYIRAQCLKHETHIFDDWNWNGNDDDWKSKLERYTLAFAYRHGPTGWHDANIAFYIEAQLDVIGPQGETAWLQGPERSDRLRARLDREYAWKWNPRRAIGAIALPNIGNIFSGAAKTLFHRRCLIIACALERHRMMDGRFPASLEVVKEELKLFNIADPARPAMLPGYRLEAGGYLLWSAGMDARDDGGTKDKDWLWRMNNTSKSP